MFKFNKMVHKEGGVRGSKIVQKLSLWYMDGPCEEFDSLEIKSSRTLFSRRLRGAGEGVFASHMYIR